MGSQDLFFGLSGWLLIILLIYTIIKNHRSIYEFIRNTTIYEWWKDPKNRKNKDSIEMDESEFPVIRNEDDYNQLKKEVIMATKKKKQNKKKKSRKKRREE